VRTLLERGYVEGYKEAVIRITTGGEESPAASGDMNSIKEERIWETASRMLHLQIGAPVGNRIPRRASARLGMIKE